ncbi:MAG: hypothetical protein GQ538_03090 [Xanthomonadales bacterium]|nr:hypothetical protein [Xanthomonadales bacterium]
MAITLSGPWRTIKRNIKKDTLYPAQITYTRADGQQSTFDVEVAPRGLTRRFKTCKFPPLKIHFDKEKMKGSEFRGNKSLKLVTYCHSNKKYEQYYTKEYLAYRIFNLITEFSFRVQPLMVEYVDSEGKSDSITRFSFLIEDADEVADRHDMEKLTISRVSHKKLDPAETSNVAIFQYMIGNLDWAATGGPDKDKCCHNSKIIAPNMDAVPKYVVPYDFDSSGIVNAHYAAPPAELKVRTIRQRLFRGFCSHNATLPQAVERFQTRKPEILALFEDDPNLSEKNLSNTLKYIEEFYKVIDDPKRFKKNITDKCRG